MLQPEHLQVPSLSLASRSHSMSAVQQERRTSTLERSDATTESDLRKQIPATISANKRAMIDRLITQWATGELDQ